MTGTSNIPCGHANKRQISSNYYFCPDCGCNEFVKVNNPVKKPVKILPTDLKYILDRSELAASQNLKYLELIAVVCRKWWNPFAMYKVTRKFITVIKQGVHEATTL